ncbi:nucleotidyltransferase domain-containing protein [Rhizobium sp. L43]|uniref:nucleotidyltransferase domain-containing protein n=1 Tax=Rhizobium sp. L43 TaxID=2035452 RepID=UPI000BE8DFA3|nr:nucleotidyltransferase domain-containing protein [Rhizobium sp. L43]PDS79772.1 nucleotidyltransferase [Rhizobium sp. L43]
MHADGGIGGFDPEAVKEIRSRLASVREQDIRIGFAIESGSRAWGFPSPDSDYDCRFVYIRPVEHHLSLVPVRDVIEFPIVGDIDTGGWDLRKALQLALKGNAVVVEWLKSPIAYEEEAGFRSRLGALLDLIMVPEKVAAHYIGLMRQHFQNQGDGAIKLKKLLYAVRPAIALEWMRQRSFRALPPMNMLECLEAINIAGELRTAILDLVQVKKQTREMGQGLPPMLVQSFLQSSFEHYSETLRDFGSDPDRDQRAQHLADKFYVQEVLQRDS